MCYNSTSPFLFLQTYYSLTIGYIQKRVTISSKRLTVSLKKVDGFFKKGRPFWAKRSTFFVIVLSVMSTSTKPKETTIEVVLRLLDLLISW